MAVIREQRGPLLEERRGIGFAGPGEAIEQAVDPGIELGIEDRRAIRSSSGSAPRPGPCGTSTPPSTTGTVLANGVAPKSANIRSSGESFSFAAMQCNTARKAGPI
jgi:hypothetical protein